MSTANVFPGGLSHPGRHEDCTNTIAHSVIENLKAGVIFKGTVRSHSSAGAVNITWIAIQLPLAEERQVLVKGEPGLRLGQDVLVECVPNPSKPEHYMFRIAGAQH
jgi:hypothetical protein